MLQQPHEELKRLVEMTMNKNGFGINIKSKSMMIEIRKFLTASCCMMLKSFIYDYITCYYLRVSSTVVFAVLLLRHLFLLYEISSGWCRPIILVHILL